jgi:hypothetical protein
VDPAQNAKMRELEQQLSSLKMQADRDKLEADSLEQQRAQHQRQV